MSLWKRGPFLSGAFVILGAPDDRGVRIAHGRVGAKAGPAAIRRELYRLTIGAGGELARCRLYDAGNVRSHRRQEETYHHLSRIVQQIVRHGAVPILLGGGHDLSFGGLHGLLTAYPGAAVISVDPHCDCRPPEADGRYSSGAGIRLLFETGVLRRGRFGLFGYQPERNAPPHYRYLKDRQADCVSRAEASRAPAPILFRKMVRRLAKPGPALGVSFDMDCVDAASAPGVSALNVHGFSAPEAVAFFQAAGENRQVKYVDIMEVNPACDPDGRTARLAAVLIYHFLARRVYKASNASIGTVNSSSEIMWDVRK